MLHTWRNYTSQSLHWEIHSLDNIYKQILKFAWVFRLFRVYLCYMVCESLIMTCCHVLVHIPVKQVNDIVLKKKKENSLNVAYCVLCTRQGWMACCLEASWQLRTMAVNKYTAIFWIEACLYQIKYAFGSFTVINVFLAYRCKYLQNLRGEGGIFI